MAKTIDETLGELEKLLDQLLMNQPTLPISSKDISHPTLKSVVSKMNSLSHYIMEVNTISGELANGQVDGFTPPRQNMLAAHLKMLQSHLSTLVWSIQELMRGKIVGKLAGDEKNELFTQFNRIIDMVAQSSTQSGDSNYMLTDSNEERLNSWRYHQILAAVNNLDILVIEVNESGKIVYANTAAKKLLGNFEHVYPDRAELEEDTLARHLARNSSDTAPFPIVEEIYDENRATWFRITSDHFLLPHGVAIFLHVVDDITDWKNKQEQLEQTANFDALTGTLSRRVGMFQLRQLNERYVEDTHCIAFVDIDGLKAVNDTYGHSEGDAYIKIISNVLQKLSRPTEIVVRYGGDEFFILFQNSTIDVAKAIMQRMEDRIDELNENKVKPYMLSFSYGLEEFGGDIHIPTEELLDRVDFNMYRNKTKKKANRQA